MGYCLSDRARRGSAASAAPRQYVDVAVEALYQQFTAVWGRRCDYHFTRPQDLGGAIDEVRVTAARPPTSGHTSLE
jgi:hypothetical protein